MGLFSRKKDAPRSRVEPAPFVPRPLSTFDLAPVEFWAEQFLRGAGLGVGEIDRLKSAYPTAVPAPNPDHVFDAGDPPNPWTLAMACAEQALGDALGVYIYHVGKFLPADVVNQMYAQGGLEILVGVIAAREQPQHMSEVKDLVNRKIQSSFDAFFLGMLLQYLRDRWPKGEPFRARAG